MELPFEIDFEPPTTGDLRHWLKGFWSWQGLLGFSAAIAAIATGLWLHHHFSASPGANLGSVSVSTNPAEAFLSIDGQVRGQTPLGLPLRAGRHILSLTVPGYARCTFPSTSRRAGRRRSRASYGPPASSCCTSGHPYPARASTRRPSRTTARWRSTWSCPRTSTSCGSSIPRAATVSSGRRHTAASP